MCVGKNSEAKVKSSVYEQKGFVSLLVLLVLVFLSWKGFVVFYKVSSYERITRYEAQRIEASCAADSGLEWAEANLKRNPAWQGGSRHFAGGEITVEVVKKDQIYTVTSSSRQERTVQKKYGSYLQTGESLVLIRYGERYD